MSQLEQEIKDAIAKQLPAQVGDVLRSRLEQAQKDAEDLSVVKDRFEVLRNENAELRKQLARESAKLLAHGELEKREAEVTKRENKLAVELAEARAKNSETSTAALFNLMQIVFKNPTIKEQVFGSIGGHSGNNYQAQATNETRTREIE